MTLDEIRKIKDDALSALEEAETPQAVEAVRVKVLGRKGLLPGIMKSLKDFDPAERAEAGRLANELKRDVGDRVKARLREFQGNTQPAVRPAAPAGGGFPETPQGAPFDYSLPGLWRSTGSRHPISLVIEEAVRIFASLGFTIADGPDIETEYNNFDALNTPADHPSRDIQDTYWLPSGELLRTQTSPVQIRVMKDYGPPVRIIAPGRCYRRDRVDASHSANFHQIEGLYVDTHVSLRDLKSDITYFARRMIGPTVQVRFRPHFFPFTEPSVEYDFSCHLCSGAGCRLCKQSGWIEISGAGMVNPKVLAAVGYDPSAVSGYAFGMGVERIAMIKYGIEDIRMCYENDLRYLSQFR